MKKQHVDFPIAKLLKEKGIYIVGTSVFNFESDINETDLSNYIPELNITINDKDFTEDLCFPEIWEVVEWFFEKCGYWVYTKQISEGNWMYDISEGIFCINAKDKFNSPKEAYLAAFKHILEKLI
jgi:hypothetical protein